MKRKQKTQQIKKRRRQRLTVSWLPLLRHLPWKPIGGMVLLCLVVSTGLFFDPARWFRMQTITVAGPTKHLSIEDIEELASPSFGVPIMALDLDPIRKRIAQHPWVRAVGLRRLLPGTLYIHVDEHRPAAIVSYPELFLVSDEGILFKKAEPSDQKNLPFITGLVRPTDEAQVQARQRIIHHSTVIINVLDRSGALEPFGLSELHWEDQRTLSLITQHHPFQIKLGKAPWQHKIDRLFQVLPHLTRDGKIPTRVLLDHGEGVIVRYSKMEKRKL